MADPVIEILAYTPIDMNAFLKFSVEGKPDGSGDFETDEQGRKITGVFRWLHGREVTEAHFFHSAAGDAVQFFAAMILRRESYDVPWMRRIPGFENMVKDDGLIGKTNAFAPLGDLLALVKHDQQLDDIFAAGKTDIDSIFADMQIPEKQLSVSRKGLLATLRGDIGTDPQETFAEVIDKFKIRL